MFISLSCACVRACMHGIVTLPPAGINTCSMSGKCLSLHDNIYLPQTVTVTSQRSWNSISMKGTTVLHCVNQGDLHRFSKITAQIMHSKHTCIPPKINTYFEFEHTFSNQSPDNIQRHHNFVTLTFDCWAFPMAGNITSIRYGCPHIYLELIPQTRSENS